MNASRLRRRPSVALAATAVLGLACLAFSACTAEANAEVKAISGINAIRTQGGLPPLQADARLMEVGRARSRDMAARGYFSHDPPDGCNFVCIMDRSGVPHSFAGENIAWNTYDWSQTADQAVRMWRASPPHMQNIMNCHYTKVGTGVAKAADGKIYYTMIFEGNGGC